MSSASQDQGSKWDLPVRRTQTSQARQDTQTYISIDDLEVGNIIVAQTPELEETSQLLCYLYSTNDGANKVMHKHIVLKKEESKVSTAVLTSHGQAKRGNQSLLARYDRQSEQFKKDVSEEKWLQGMKWYRRVACDIRERQNPKEPYIVEYDKTSEGILDPTLYRWVFLARKFSVRKFSDNARNGQGKFILCDGRKIKISKTSVEKIINLVEEGEQLLEKIKLGELRADEVAPGAMEFEGIQMKELPGIARPGTLAIKAEFESESDEAEGWKQVTRSEKRGGSLRRSNVRSKSKVEENGKTGAAENSDVKGKPEGVLAGKAKAEKTEVKTEAKEEEGWETVTHKKGKKGEKLNSSNTTPSDSKVNGNAEAKPNPRSKPNPKPESKTGGKPKTEANQEGWETVTRKGRKKNSDNSHARSNPSVSTGRHR